MVAAGVEWSRLATRPGDPIPGRRTLLSSGDRWDAIRVDLVHVTGPTEMPETSVADHRLVAHLDGPAQTRFWCAGMTKTGECLPGDLCIFPASMPFAIRRDRQGRIVAAYLNPRTVDEIASDEHLPGLGELRPMFRARNPLLNELILALAEEVRTDNPSGTLYAETLGTAVAAQFLRTQLRIPRERRSQAGLDPAILRRLYDYVEDHLADQVRLRDLATIAGMSTFQLVRRFKEVTGLPPHQYVTRRKIERAKQLLSEPESSVLEVALACGFASPSHFAQAFRLVTGVTPRSYRSASGS
jgi:AraC family transcriptional regulator